MRTTLDLDPRVLAAARGRVQAGSSRSIGAAVSESGPVRLLLNPAIVGHRVDGGFALVLGAVRADPRHRFISDSSTSAQARVDTVGLSGHKQVTDLHLLNLAEGAGARLVTFDRSILGLAPGLDPDRLEVL